jgi:hypothetical protein
MSTEEWTRLVQQVDRLIGELRACRTEVGRWQQRATELERLRVKDERGSRLEEQAKDRELERLRKERKRTLATVERLVAEIESLQQRVVGSTE